MSMRWAQGSSNLSAKRLLKACTITLQQDLSLSKCRDHLYIEKTCVFCHRGSKQTDRIFLRTIYHKKFCVTRFSGLNCLDNSFHLEFAKIFDLSQLKFKDMNTNMKIKSLTVL